MIFKNKIKRVLDVEAIREKHKDDEKIELEKGDKLALALSALLVFVPVLVIFILVFLGVFFLFLR